MTFKVEISHWARSDIAQTAAYIRVQSSSERADHWKKGLLVTIKTLRDLPFRYSVANESEEVGIELRECHYYSHRIIYSVIETAKTVRILRIYHSARAPLQWDDIPSS